MHAAGLCWACTQAAAVYFHLGADWTLWTPAFFGASYTVILHTSCFFSLHTVHLLERWMIHISFSFHSISDFCWLAAWLALQPFLAGDHNVGINQVWQDLKECPSRHHHIRSDADYRYVTNSDLFSGMLPWKLIKEPFILLAPSLEHQT